MLTELVRLAGNADEGRFVEHVTLRGLAFHHADWELAPQGNSSTQAAVEVPAAIMADGARHCALEGCEVAHVGGYGVWFRRGCKDCRIQRNRLFDLGAGGVRVGEAQMADSDAAESSRTLVDNNHIYDGGHVYPAGIGIWVAQSSHNRLSHNDIHDLCYSGISIGWNWNDAPNRTHHNTIELNHVHHMARRRAERRRADLLPRRIARQRDPQQRVPRHVALLPAGVRLGDLPRRHLRKLSRWRTTWSTTRSAAA